MSVENWLIREDLEGGVTRLVLNRPPVNALNSDFLDLLGAHLDRLQADTAVKAVILASNSKVLSAGMDLKEALGFDLKDQQAMVRSLNVNFTKLFGFPKPTIVAASGAAIAGGFFSGACQRLPNCQPQGAFWAGGGAGWRQFSGWTAGDCPCNTGVE